LNKYYQPTPANKREAKLVNKIINMSNNAIISKNKHHILEDDKLYKNYVKEYDKGKYMALLYLLSASLKKPYMLKIIIKKLMYTMELFIRRMKGEKVRW
jgi:hypothetical protein